MNVADVIPIIVVLPSTVVGASSAAEAWADLQRQVNLLAAVVSDATVVKLDAEIADITTQLKRMFSESPPPDSLTLLYFGLFTALDTTGTERAGYYVSGSTRDVPPVEVSSQLAGEVLDYRPTSRYLWSELLERIRMGAMENSATHELFDYPLMLGAATIISWFATRRLGLQCRIVVGFDSGDAVELPGLARSAGGARRTTRP